MALATTQSPRTALLCVCLPHAHPGTAPAPSYPPATKDFPSLQKFFSSKGDTATLFEELDTDGNNEVSWSEFLVFLEKLEMEPNTNVSDEDFAKFFKDMNVEEEEKEEKVRS